MLARSNGPLTCRVPDNYGSGVEISSSFNSPWSCRLAACRNGNRDWDDRSSSIRFGPDPVVVRIPTVNGPVTIDATLTATVNALARINCLISSRCATSSCCAETGRSACARRMTRFPPGSRIALCDGLEGLVALSVRGGFELGDRDELRVEVVLQHLSVLHQRRHLAFDDAVDPFVAVEEADDEGR